MNILILGGSGFLSGTLARAAQARGAAIWALTRGKRPLADGITSLIADRRDQAAFADAIAGVQTEWDLVIDCIAFAPEDIRQDVEILRQRARRLVFVSTDFVYEPTRRRFPQAEEPAEYTEAGYGGQKRLCEQALADADTGAMSWTVVRPCHIYGPGSQLGCLPLHGRDPQLIARLQAGETLKLVGGGHFLQQPILASDLAELLLAVGTQPSAAMQTFCAAGPDIVESREYYRLIAEQLGVELRVEEIAVDAYLAEHPEAAPFLCHRIYDMSKLKAHSITPPQTPLATGLREHVISLIQE